MLRKVGGLRFAWGSEQWKMLFIVSWASTAISGLEQKWLLLLLCCQDYCIYSNGDFHWASLYNSEGWAHDHRQSPGLAELWSQHAFPGASKGCLKSKSEPGSLHLPSQKPQQFIIPASRNPRYSYEQRLMFMWNGLIQCAMIFYMNFQSLEVTAVSP